MGLRDSHEKSEQSIKARKSELFQGNPAPILSPLKPFPDYLRDTPPTPLTKTTRVVLWTVAVMVGLLFLIALTSSRGHRRLPVHPKAAADWIRPVCKERAQRLV